MMPVKIHKAGSFIAPLLRSNVDGKVIGITSKGIFVLFGDRVVFLTGNSIDNPFSIQIDDPEEYPGGLALNTRASLADNHLRMGEWDLDLSSLTEIAPEPLPQVKAHAMKGTIVSQIVSIFQLLDRGGHEDSCLFVVDALFNKRVPVDPAKQELWVAVRNLRQGTRAKDLAACEDALKLILGNGMGLTPSGDDITAGYLLILNCLLNREGAVDEFTSQLNALALELARKQTTWISANLIEAAIQRLVDERVGMAAMVLLNTCKMDPVTIARKLESFGNSSGIDAFAGMAAALLPA